MSDIIRLLPDSLANQIAAGEVVQRPASAIKEMLENSVDAQSTNIQLLVRNAGKTLIQVIDNGLGMSETDARMCFERHATSKIKTPEDLFKIHTFGFRGEAMASIAAVAQIEMKTRRSDMELATKIEISGSNFVSQELVSAPLGTSISIKNLFFNVPARRNFLKSDIVEFKHISDEFTRVAMAYPNIAFSFFHNDQEVFNLKEGKLSQRIIHLFGKTYKDKIVACSESVNYLSVKGYVGKPEFAKKTRGEQFFFVNNRFIKHPYLHHAVMTAYEGLLTPETYPLYTLFIEIDAEKIDVNVHPTKTEIKFEDDRTVYALIQSAVRQALGRNHAAAPIDFAYDVNFGRVEQINETRESKMNYDNFQKTPLEKSNLRNWQKLYEDVSDENTPSWENILEKADEPEISLTFESQINEEEPKNITDNTFQLHKQYVVSQVKSGLLMVDQQAAHERILYEKFLLQLNNQSGLSQQLLFPQKVVLNEQEMALLNELKPDLYVLGFIFEEEKELILKGIPVDMMSENAHQLLENLIEQFYHQQALSLGKHENLALSMAKNAGIRKMQALSKTEIDSLINQLFACANPNYTAEGKKTYLILTVNNIEEFFEQL
ncbi:MAG: DNA mismatch repair endonuclease MutL [Bacteroidetes bacterium]|nr:MAG: DNA mismatch repair endonuclease MutL [Bacteroidota bacterium]